MRHACVLVVALAGTAAVQAQVDIRMDLATSVGTTGGNWNNISNLTGMTPNLIDFTSGSPTSIGIDGIGSPWSPFFGDDAGSFPNQDWLVQPATKDGAGLQRDQTGVFRISGLNSSAYKIEVVSARSTFGYLNSITVNGATATSTFKGTPVVTPWNSTADGLDKANWLIWSNVFPTSGTIDIRDVAGPGTLGIVNAIRISQVPAPAAALPLIAGVAFAARRRRS